MPITNLTQSVNLTSKTNFYLNRPSEAGLSSGYWFYYSASAANSTIPGKIVPYRWGTQLATDEGTTLTMEGTIPIASESLNRRRLFHGSTITRIGPGINDITLAEEEDAFFFYHIGAQSAGDTPGYWDRAYKLSVGSGDWDYYQYHQHSPNVYASYDNARVAQASYTYINSSDKRYGYLQPIQVKSGPTNYLNVLARIHQPSVGGAHNSHNDIELGSSTTTNYMIGGMLPGTSDKFHAFYVSATGSNQHYVYSRTYVLSLGSFTAEINHGAYNLAPPSFSISQKTYEKPPVRASAGALMGSKVYIPVVYYSGSVPSNKFDLKIWEFNSENSISTGDIVVTNLLTGSNYPQDCHLAAANGELNAVVTDVNAGCIGYYKMSGSSWVKQGDVVTNGTQEVLRIHGFEYNPQDNLFYVLISGDITGSVGNYSGSGIYSFSDGTPFAGYEHLSFITSSYGFQLRNALQTGHLRYTNLDGSLVFKSGSEPQGYDESYEVLQFNVASPQFFDYHETHLGGKEYFYAGTKLVDGRLVLVGNIENNEGNKGGPDLLMTLFPANGGDAEYYAVGTDGIDYFTGVVEDTQRGCLWMTGYTRGYFVPIRDLKVHAFGRGYVDADNKLEWADLALDTTGSQYMAGKHTERDSIIVAKYDANIDEVWQRDLTHASFVSNSAYGITVDSNNNSYIAGTSDNKALVVKLDQTGSTLFSNIYTENGGEYASSIAYVTKSSSEYIVVPVVSGSSTIVTVLDLTGSIVEQNRISDFVVNKVRKSDTEPGYFLLAGKDSQATSKAKIAKGEVLSSGDMIKWVNTYSSASLSFEANDIRNTEAATAQVLGSLSGSKYHVVGTEGSSSFVTKIVVDEQAGSYQPTKLWGKGFVSSSLSGVAYNVQDGETNSYVVGNSAYLPEGEGMDDTIIAKFDKDGNRVWSNSLGHMGDDVMLAIERDITGDNIYTAGWSESHTNGRRTFLFRSEVNGFGTGNYHLEGYAGLEIQYKSSSVAMITSSGSLDPVSPPSDFVGSLTKTAATYTNINLQYIEEIYDGGVSYDMFIAKFDLQSFQTHKNDPGHVAHNLRCDAAGPEYLDDYFSFWQVGTSGDGVADDGNYFGYDILLMTGSNKVFIAGQTSGDIGAYNASTVSGVYDYCLAVFDPETEKFEFYQSGSNEDEEIYAAAELSDGSGSIAFVGRSIGNFAGTSNGGYDIFLGIYNPITDERRYFNTGSVLNDRGVNVHDLGNNELAIVYETADAVTDEIDYFGGFDIGVIKFNYSSSQWATSSFQVGSLEDEFLSQDGKPSVLLEDGRIVVTGRTLGPFAETGQSAGGSDMFLGILDLEDGTYQTYQVGTAGNENGTTVVDMGGGQVVVAGYTDASFQEPVNAIYAKFDLSLAPKARTLET